MVLTDPQTPPFFECDDQMALPHDAVIQLVIEEVNAVNDLEDFVKDILDQVSKNLRGGGFQVSVKSEMSLLHAADAVWHHLDAGQLTAGAKMWRDSIIKNFAVKLKALLDRKKEDDPEVPKITKTLTVAKWTEMFSDDLARCFGADNAPLICVA